MNIELRRKKLEIQKVLVAREEMELQVAELQAQIERVQLNIKNQDKRALELQQSIDKEVNNG